MKNRDQYEQGLFPDPEADETGPYDAAPAEADLWFLPGPDTEEDADPLAPPLPRAPRTSLVDLAAWRAAEAALAQPLGSRFCKIKLSFWINLLNAGLGIVCFWLPVQYWLIPLVAHFLIQTVQGGNGALQWSMITDANNYGEWKTQRRITGMNVAANIFVIKLGVAVGGAILGWVLAGFEYQASAAVQSPQAVQGVVWLFTLIPSLFYLLTALAIKFYRLDEQVMNTVVTDLNNGKFAKP